MTTVDDRGVDPFDAPRGAQNRAPADASPGTGVNRWKWQDVYVKRLYVTDALVVVLSVLLAQWVRFGYEELLLAGEGAALEYSMTSATIIVAWLGALSLFRTRSRRVIGAGYDEYQRVISATLAMFGTIAIIALITNEQIARGFLAIALPVGSRACCSLGGCGGR